ncbi:MAG: ATP-binding protein [Anaerolineae bacterium]
MKSRKFYQSLRFKITVGITIPLLIVLAIVSYLRYSSHRDLMMDDLRLSASNLGEIIEGSLQHSMLTNDFAEVQGIVDGIAARGEVKELFLLDNKGRIVISAGQERVGTVLDLSDTTCQSCHERKAVDRSLTCIFATDQGERVFRNLNPIENREECQGCHESGEKTLGVLITDFSMATIDRHLATDRRNSLLWSIGTIAAVMLVVGLTMNRLVVARLKRFMVAIKSLSKGDLDQRVAIESNDEIGELAAAFNYMTEELHDKEVLRGRLLEKIITAQEDERKRIARELHDETGQTLTSLMVGLRALEGATCLEEVRDTADQLRTVAAQTLDSLHSLALELRPSVLDDLGLVAALKRYVKDYAAGFGLDADFEAVGLEEKRLTPQVETTLYRIVQEALTNVARHAEASHVSVLLERRRDSVIGIVEDDGRGFEVEGVFTSGQPTRLGLHGMQERASLVGGKLTLESTPGIGTTVFIEIPLDDKR